MIPVAGPLQAARDGLAGLLFIELMLAANRVAAFVRPGASCFSACEVGAADEDAAARLVAFLVESDVAGGPPQVEKGVTIRRAFSRRGSIVRIEIAACLSEAS